ncbi:MAG: 50S ribosomal protein L18 [Patescibacteria group bacterium]|nr:50S ribosomal protein L18 [Patescibacteria group bacterium]
MNKEKIKSQKKNRRRSKIRSQLEGVKDCPRFSVYRSNTGMFVQLIDDNIGSTLVSAHSKEIKPASKAKAKSKKLKSEQFMVETELGRLIANKAEKKNIKQVVFDRGGRKYHGRIKAVADGARAGGLKF